MKHLYLFVAIAFIITPQISRAQYEFSGHIDKNIWRGDIYLSLIEDYRKVSGIHTEQIIQKATPDSTGYFRFSGDNLPLDNRIYKIQVENCFTNNEPSLHFKGHCTQGKEILFIANNKDTLSTPLSSDQEMFCRMYSTNEKSIGFIKIDSIINEMQFAFSTYRSETNRKINSKRWCTALQEYGVSIKEPLIELYIYSLLSDKTNELHSYYLEDLKTNTYYDQLFNRLLQKYPDSPYIKQYEPELAADKFLINSSAIQSSNRWWIYVILILLTGSVLLNIFQLFQAKKTHNHSVTIDKNLTEQEQKILNLILEDKTNKEIAATMFISLSTVKTHINNLYKKLNVRSREEVKSL
ncbi:hypothetical protein GCM10022393_37500 [Aquimarina addita]|uniref:HTH luxR-type domain-containing protein n=1 Tax=Aquimarina addita TaxID=870485 RepID=A0ABP6UVU9_9FLAO